MNLIAVGLDIAKSIFQLHGIDAVSMPKERRCSESSCAELKCCDFSRNSHLA